MQKAVRVVIIMFIFLGLCSGSVLAQESSGATALGVVPSVLGSPDLSGDGHVELTSGTYAVFHTSEGDFIAELKAEVAPLTVQNFVAYATGQKSWRHPVTMVETTRPLYSNTTIYRTVPKAMIFGGDPINRGEGDSGTQLPLETSREVRFDQPGLLAMDASGTKMSGSRWFITLRPFPERSGQYTIFGKVIGGLELVQRISLKPVKRPQLPLDPVMVYFIEIVRVPGGRITTGEFRMENGMKVLRIDPNFQDAPVQEEVPSRQTPTADETTTVSNEMTTETDAVEEAADEDTGENEE